MVSPLRAGELMAGKTIPFAIIGLIDLALVFAIAFLWFQVPFRGSALLLIVASLLYLLSALGIGLFISTISKTQQEAFMASFLVYMPTILLSGFMFPVSSMPDVFQWSTVLKGTVVTPWASCDRTHPIAFRPLGGAISTLERVAVEGQVSRGFEAVREKSPNRRCRELGKRYSEKPR